MTYAKIVTELAAHLKLAREKYPDHNPHVYFDARTVLGSLTPDTTYQISVSTSAACHYQRTSSTPQLALDELWRWLNELPAHAAQHIQNLGELPTTEGVSTDDH